MMATYFEQLALVFWKSDNYLVLYFFPPQFWILLCMLFNQWDPVPCILVAQIILAVKRAEEEFD